MVKQRVIICLDNTEFMRNGDYAPTRFAAQQKTTEGLIGKVLRSHPESLCSLLSMSNPTIEKSLTDNRQALQATLTQVPIRGESIDMIKSLKIAQLALKKRGEESTGEKRVILFVASPLQHSVDDLKKVGSIFKRYNISVDVINFGEITTNQEKLEAFVEAVDTDNTSHILTVPQGPHLLSDMVASSEVLTEPGQEPGAGSGGGNAGFDGMEDDPEYAMALQLSLQEYEREQQQRRDGGEDTSKGETTTQQSTTAPITQQQQQPTSEAMEDDEIDMDEDEMMRQALEMSRADFQQQQEAPKQPVKDEEKIAQQPEIPRPEDEMVDDDEDEELQAALRMSMMQAEEQPPAGGETIDDIMGDEAFLKDVVSNITK
eukprot:CAMPEP_0117447734 /NCGR_PEP_ID=MMETSP0759-20121206/7032_1 /TAXON_ID=63605 /ORGANISM="Percolomonas cosmopolitus, Strain WS" /LENGTH=372 /DNA_ID=CAMNT_0005240087 /DNA_START=194 /DNA_END=1309 /DNA_ORIENTATION=+